MLSAGNFLARVFGIGALLLSALAAAAPARAAGTLVNFYDGVPLWQSSSNDFIQTTALITDLRNFTGTLICLDQPHYYGSSCVSLANSGNVVDALGQTAINDGLGGLFDWNPLSSASDDGLNVIQPSGLSGAGRWIREIPIASALATGAIFYGVGGTATAETPTGDATLGTPSGGNVPIAVTAENGNSFPTSATLNHVATLLATGMYKDSGSALPAAANPTATAGPTAINGSSASFMRADAAPPVQKASSSQFGISECDNATIACSGGVFAAATATTGQLGVVKPDGTTILVSAGVISASTTLTGRLIGIQTFCASGCSSTGGTYTPDTGTNSVIVEGCAAGNTGGNTGGASSSTTNASLGSGGSAGGYARVRYTSGFSGVSVTIGATGANTTFGSLITFGFGTVGTNGPSPATSEVVAGVAGGANTISSGTILANVTGGDGSPAFYMASLGWSGKGGDSPLGKGGQAVAVSSTSSVQSAGNGGEGFCSGGSGAVSANSASGSSETGGAAKPAIVIVYEFSWNFAPVNDNEGLALVA
jgi:hypothetical protein